MKALIYIWLGKRNHPPGYVSRTGQAELTMDGSESGTEEIVRHERQSVQEKQQPENDEAKRQRPQVGQSRIW